MPKNNVKDLYTALSNLQVFQEYTTDVYGDDPTTEINIFGDVEVTIIYSPFDFEGKNADDIMHIMTSTFKVEVICKFTGIDWVAEFINELNDGGRRSVVFDNTFPDSGLHHYVFNINYLGGN